MLAVEQEAIIKPVIVIATNFQRAISPPTRSVRGKSPVSNPGAEYSIYVSSLLLPFLIPATPGGFSNDYLYKLGSLAVI